MKRFDLELCDGESGTCRADLREAADGDWVLFSDTEFLSNEVRRLRDNLDLIANDYFGTVEECVNFANTCRLASEAFEIAKPPSSEDRRNG